MSDEEHFKYREDFVETEDSNSEGFIPSGAVKLKSCSANTKKKNGAPRKLKNQWDHQQIVHLISLVKQHRGLWDVDSAEYKMSRLDGWREVVDALNVDTIDVNEAKLKWMNLRLAFKTNMAKLRTKKLDQSAKESVSITWKYFSLLKFLEAKDVAQSTEPVSTMVLANAATDQSIFNDNALDQSLPPPPTIGIRRKHQTISTSTATNEIATQVLSGALSSLNRYDKHTIIGDFVASELRTLPSHESDALRMDVMRTVMAFLENRQTVVSQPMSLVDETESEIELP